MRFAICCVLFLVGVALWPARAQQRAVGDPTGRWETIDEETGRVSGEVRIVVRDGVVSGRISQVLDPSLVHANCDRCTDDRKGQPVVGLEILRGLRRDGDGTWSGGTVLDPTTGATYRASLRLAENGRQLIVRGSVLGGLIGGTRTWLRVDP